MTTSSSHSAHASRPAPAAQAGGAPPLPRIALLAMGGTIAGAAPDATHTAAYQAAVLSVTQLLDAVPALAGTAVIHAEQIANIDSREMSVALWLTLAARINALLASDAIDGVVITHGTDTLEETAYLLHLTVKSAKPVVLTAAMRPATALSADGPLNLLNAVTLAGCPQARGKGVLVALNNQVHCARDVTKTSTYAVDAFRSPEVGVLGWVQDGRVEFQRTPSRAHTLATPFELTPAGAARVLPLVEIVTSYAGASGALCRAMVEALCAGGVRGIVVAGTGNGSIHAELQQALAAAAARGVAVVRASRVGAGHVMRNGAAPDDALGFTSAGTLSPYKARILLMLALAQPCGAMQEVFDLY